MMHDRYNHRQDITIFNVKRVLVNNIFVMNVSVDKLIGNMISKGRGFLTGKGIDTINL